MPRGFYHQQEDEKKIKLLMDNEPALTRPLAEVAVRLNWILQLAEDQKNKTYVLWGDGFTPEDDDWHTQIRAEHVAKTWNRPFHKDPMAEKYLIDNGY